MTKGNVISYTKIHTDNIAHTTWEPPSNWNFGSECVVGITHLSDIDFTILIVIVGLHEAGLQLFEHGVRYCLGIGTEGLRCNCSIPLQTYLWTNVCGIGTRHELPQESVQLGALNVAIS